MWLTLLWNQRQLIAEIIVAIVLATLAWYLLIHQPKVIKELKADKAELSRQVENGKNAIRLLGDIQTGKEINHATVAKKIQEIQQSAIPHHAVLIEPGVLSSMPKTSTTTNGTSPGPVPGGK